MHNLLYSKKHLWVRVKDAVAELGITDYAKEKLGSIVFLNLPDVGDSLEIGQTFGDIESVKTVSDLIAPVLGTVISVNEELLEKPYGITEEPYASWLVKINVKELDKELMDERQYGEYLKTI